MRASDYGPVSMSRWKTEQAQIYEALAQGRRVLVAERGKVVAAFVPAEQLPVGVLAMYALPQIDTKPFEINASVMNQQLPPPGYWLKRAKANEPALVTSKGKLYGMLRAMSAEDLEPDGPSAATATKHDKAIEQFINDHPDATADELARFTAGLEEAVSPPKTAPEEMRTLVAEMFGSDNPTAAVRKRRSKDLYLDRVHRMPSTSVAAEILGVE